MKVTVCELRDDPVDFAQDWERLVAHIKAENSDLVLLPEMAFYPWFCLRREYDPNIWQEAVKTHEKWEGRLQELAPAAVLGSCPINKGNKRLNQGYVWDIKTGICDVHEKYYLPDEECYWEASWYQMGNGKFEPVKICNALVGFVICTDIWFFEHSYTYGKKGVQIIACPRTTPRSTLDKWLAGGRTASVVSGAYCISSNRVNSEGKEANLGGLGWIVDPDGEVLGTTSQKQPFLTVEIDLNKADLAKKTYPRYVKE